MNRSARISSAAPLIVVMLGILFFIITTARAQDAVLTSEPTVAEAVPTSPQDAAPIATVEAAPVTIVSPGSGVVLVQPADTPPIVYIALAIVVVLVIGVMIYQNQIINLVAGLTTPETARSFVQTGISLGGELALNNLANQTPTQFDNDAIVRLFTARHFKVTRLEDGSYHIEPPELVPTTPPATAAPTTTINITHNDSAPGGGATADGSTPFPSSGG